MLEAVPELADGGFWYHVDAEPVDLGDRISRRPAVPRSVGYTATYLDDGTVIVRCPFPHVGIDTVGSQPGRRLVEAGRVERPYGRIAGR